MITRMRIMRGRARRAARRRITKTLGHLIRTSLSWPARGARRDEGIRKDRWVARPPVESVVRLMICHRVGGLETW
eukprot:8638628-Pyramimonas_sp.AAC.1